MLTFSEYFKEARRNPEMNPRIGAIEQLAPFSHQENMFISFTKNLGTDKIPNSKLGMYPSSDFKTPWGIYAYPLSIVWDYYSLGAPGSLSNLPYAADRPYIQLFKVKDQYWDNVINLSHHRYSEEDYFSDTEKLRSWFIQRFPTKGYVSRLIDRLELAMRKDYAPDTNIPYSEPIEDVYDIIVEFSKGSAKAPYPIVALWNLTRLLGLYTTEPEDGRIFATNRWNVLLRRLGYFGFVDEGGSIIHENEPMQAVFFSKEYIEQIAQIRNKDSIIAGVTRLDFDSLKEVIKNGVKANNQKNAEEVVKVVEQFMTTDDWIEMSTSEKAMVKMLFKKLTALVPGYKGKS